MRRLKRQAVPEVGDGARTVAAAEAVERIVASGRASIADLRALSAAARARDAGDAWTERSVDAHATIEVADALRALQVQRDAGTIDRPTFETSVRTVLERFF